MNKNEYRTLINEILDGEKIKIAPILREHNIDSGNFSSFLKSEQNNKRMKLSNLEHVYEELKKLSRKTNKERLASLSIDALSKELQKQFIDNPRIKDIDVRAWLESEDEEMKYLQ